MVIIAILITIYIIFFLHYQLLFRDPFGRISVVFFSLFPLFSGEPITFFLVRKSKIKQTKSNAQSNRISLTQAPRPVLNYCSHVHWSCPSGAVLRQRQGCPFQMSPTSWISKSLLNEVSCFVFSLI